MSAPNWKSSPEMGCFFTSIIVSYSTPAQCLLKRFFLPPEFGAVFLSIFVFFCVVEWTTLRGYSWGYNKNRADTPMPLNDRKIKNANAAEKEHKLFDGGLFLLIKTNSRKYWRLKYRFANRERSRSIWICNLFRLCGSRHSIRYVITAKKQY